MGSRKNNGVHYIAYDSTMLDPKAEGYSRLGSSTVLPRENKVWEATESSRHKHPSGEISDTHRKSIERIISQNLGMSHSIFLKT